MKPENRTALKALVKEIIFEVLAEEFATDIIHEISNKIQIKLENKSSNRNIPSLSETFDSDNGFKRNENVEANPQIKEMIQKKYGNSPLGRILAETAENLGDDIEPNGTKINYNKMDINKNQMLAGITEVEEEVIQPKRKVIKESINDNEQPIKVESSEIENEPTRRPNISSLLNDNRLMSEDILD